VAVYEKQGSWWIDWYEGGRRRRKETNARTKTEAKKLLGQVKAKLLPRDLGLFDPKLSCAELVTRYLEAKKNVSAEQTWSRAEIALRNFFTWCPVKRVMKLTPELFDRYVGYRKGQGVGVRTINIELTNLKTCLNWGVKNRLIPLNPLALASKLRGESKGRLRFLSEDEMARLLKAAQGTLYHDIFYTLIRTGLRKGELIHLRWEDVDFDNALIRIGGYDDEHGVHDTKTHAVRHLPMDDELAGILARQQRRPGSPFVFATEQGSPRNNNLLRELKRYAERAGIAGATLHVLRHTFASHLVMNGVDLPTVKELMGHSTIELTMRYAHLAQDHLREAMAGFTVPNFRDGPAISVGPGFKRTATK
jgi:integrase